jgi:hypothetical protein
MAATFVVRGDWVSLSRVSSRAGIAHKTALRITTVSPRPYSVHAFQGTGEHFVQCKCARACKMQQKEKAKPTCVWRSDVRGVCVYSFVSTTLPRGKWVLPPYVITTYIMHDGHFWFLSNVSPMTWKNMIFQNLVSQNSWHAHPSYDRNKNVLIYVFIPFVLWHLKNNDFFLFFVFFSKSLLYQRAIILGNIFFFKFFILLLLVQ